MSVSAKHRTIAADVFLAAADAATNGAPAVDAAILESVAAFWRFARPNGGTVELQALAVPGGYRSTNETAFASSPREAARLLAEMDRRRPTGSYFIANVLREGVDSRRAHGRWFAMDKGQGFVATTDGDMAWRSVLFVDCDAVRPKGTSSTAVELDHACHLATAARALLVAAGVPEAAIGSGRSGNGAALCVALEGVPCDADSLALVRDVLFALDVKLSGPHATIDTSTSDPKRLIPGWGSMKRKGAEGIAERPHRRTAFECAEHVERVTREALEHVRDEIVGTFNAEQLAGWRKATDRKDPKPLASPDATSSGRTPDVWAYARERCPIREVLERCGKLDGDQPICPGCGESDGSTVAIVGNGLKCMHNRCSARAMSGFRSTVDVVMEALRLDQAAALRQLGEWFGFDVPRTKATRRQPSAAPSVEAEASDDGRPVIVLGPDLHRVVAEGIAALAACRDVFVRSGELVHVSQAEYTDARRAIVEGAPHVRPLALATLRSVLTREAAWFRKVKSKDDPSAFELVPCIPPDSVVAAVHAAGHWPSLPTLVGVVETPTMRRDGSVLSAPGYDPSTGLICAPSCVTPTIPESPTQGDAMRALLTICEPLSEFAWARESDRYAIVAGLLTLLARPAIDGPIPGIAIDANQPGSGKSLLTDVIAIPATGRPAARLTWPKDPSEMEKILASYAIAGATVVAFDNVTEPIEGDALNKVLTAVSVDVRRLGGSEMLSLAWLALVLETGNGLDIRDDARRRHLLARLEPDVERPEERTGWRIPDLRAWCRENRGELVAAGLTVLRAYVVAGRPSTGTRTWGSFESWAALVPPAIVFAGGVDPMGSRLRAEDDGHRSALEALLAGWQRVAANGETVRGMLAMLYPPERLRGECAPDGLDEVRAAVETLVNTPPGRVPDARRLGEVLRRVKRRPVAGRRADVAGTRGGTAVWRVDAC